jgi:site-specific DNA-methyltransferase (adenine-specific)
MARKPLSEKTVALNVLKWGTGGINIDECRIEINLNDINQRPNGSFTIEESKERTSSMFKIGGRNPEINGNTLDMDKGRFPANLIHDGSDEVLSYFPNTKSGYMNSDIHNRTSTESPNGIYGKYNIPNEFETYGDEGSAARFFYTAKASQSERNAGCGNLEAKYLDESREVGSVGGSNPRNRGSENPKRNSHPTVKPISLIEYLVKLVTKENYIVLDMFAGSGTTGIACINLNRKCILIEKESEYIPIIQARLTEADRIYKINNSQQKLTFEL